MPEQLGEQPMARRHPAVHGLALAQDVVGQAGPAEGALDQEEGLDAVADEPRVVQGEGQGVAGPPAVGDDDQPLGPSSAIRRNSSRTASRFSSTVRRELG